MGRGEFDAESEIDPAPGEDPEFEGPTEDEYYDHEDDPDAHLPCNYEFEEAVHEDDEHAPD